MAKMSASASWFLSPCFKCDSNDTIIVTVTGPDHSQRQTRPDAEIDAFMAQTTPLGRRCDTPLQDNRDLSEAPDALSVSVSNSSAVFDLSAWQRSLWPKG